jgi:hypothetical protein
MVPIKGMTDILRVVKTTFGIKKVQAINRLMLHIKILKNKISM